MLIGGWDAVGCCVCLALCCSNQKVIRLGKFTVLARCCDCLTSAGPGGGEFLLLQCAGGEMCWWERHIHCL
jgi:hypothetical protein